MTYLWFWYFRDYSSVGGFLITGISLCNLIILSDIQEFYEVSLQDNENKPIEPSSLQTREPFPPVNEWNLTGLPSTIGPTETVPSSNAQSEEVSRMQYVDLECHYWFWTNCWCLWQLLVQSLFLRKQLFFMQWFILKRNCSLKTCNGYYSFVYVGTIFIGRSKIDKVTV